MMRCVVQGCDFYGLFENGGKCSICAGVHRLPLEASEADVMEIFGLSEADFPSSDQINDRIKFLKSLKPHRSSILSHVVSLFTDVTSPSPSLSSSSSSTECWPLIINSDNHLSVRKAMAVIGLGPRLHVQTCLEIMDIVKKATTDTVAFQKALVCCCIAPWLLEGNDDFQVGICYFGIGNGNMVTRRFLEQMKERGATRPAWSSSS